MNEIRKKACAESWGYRGCVNPYIEFETPVSEKRFIKIRFKPSGKLAAESAGNCIITKKKIKKWFLRFFKTPI